MNKNYFKGKVIIITGASSGIGLASAKLFASLGARLSLAARSIDKLKAETAGILPEEDILCVKTDVSVEDNCAALIDATVRKFGRIDILVNNAGVSMRAMFKDVDLSVLHSLMDVNFWGTVYCTKYALPHLLRSQGSVVGVISTAGYMGLPGRTGYSSSKFAIRGFLNTLRTEHLYDNLHVMVFAPGFTASNVRNAALLADGSQQGSTPRDEGKMMTAEKVAEYMAKGLARHRREMVLTSFGKATVFVEKWFPRLVEKVSFSFMAKEPDSPFKKK